MDFTFTAELWLWDARQADSWTFVSLPATASAEIRDVTDLAPRRGFGSVKVRATIGKSTWTTSVFPSTATDGYVMPIKKAVRTAEALGPGDVVTARVELVDF